MKQRPWAEFDSCSLQALRLQNVTRLNCLKKTDVIWACKLDLLALIIKVVSPYNSILNPSADNQPASSVLNPLIREAVCLMRADCMQQQTNNPTYKWNVSERINPNQRAMVFEMCHMDGAWIEADILWVAAELFSWEEGLVMQLKP